MHLKCVLMSKTNALLINESFDPLTTKIFLDIQKKERLLFSMMIFNQNFLLVNGIELYLHGK